MRASASQRLLAPIEDAWRFATDPHLLGDWWPGMAALLADRRGLAPGARWEVRRAHRPSLVRKAGATELLVVQEVEEPRLFAWHLTGERLDCVLRLTPAGADRTDAALSIASPILVGFRRNLPRVALGRLYALCQTAAES